MFPRVTLLPNAGHLNSSEDHWFVKTDDKREIGKAVQIPGCAVITPIAKVPVSACGYDALNKGHPPTQPWIPAQQIRQLSQEQSNLFNLNLSPYPPVFKELLQGLGVGGTLGPQSMRATGTLRLLALPSLMGPPISGGKGTGVETPAWCRHISLVHLPGHRGFLHAPIALFWDSYYMVLKLLLRQFSTVFSKPALACL